MRALWKGPTRCSPAYDLKFSKTISVIIRRLLPLVLASMTASILAHAAVAQCNKLKSF